MLAALEEMLDPAGGARVHHLHEAERVATELGAPVWRDRGDPRQHEPQARPGLLHLRDDGVPVGGGQVAFDHREQVAFLGVEVLVDLVADHGQPVREQPRRPRPAGSLRRGDDSRRRLAHGGQQRVEAAVVVAELGQVDGVSRVPGDHRPGDLVLGDVVAVDLVLQMCQPGLQRAGAPVRAGRAVGDRAGGVGEAVQVGAHDAVGEGDADQVGGTGVAGGGHRGSPTGSGRSVSRHRRPCAHPLAGDLHVTCATDPGLDRPANQE
nr:hypothetical protein [Pseudonocardia sp. HH130629-09]